MFYKPCASNSMRLECCIWFLCSGIVILSRIWNAIHSFVLCWSSNNKISFIWLVIGTNYQTNCEIDTTKMHPKIASISHVMNDSKCCAVLIIQLINSTCKKLSELHIPCWLECCIWFHSGGLWLSVIYEMQSTHFVSCSRINWKGSMWQNFIHMNTLMWLVVWYSLLLS